MYWFVFPVKSVIDDGLSVPSPMLQRCSWWSPGFSKNQTPNLCVQLHGIIFLSVSSERHLIGLSLCLCHVLRQSVISSFLLLLFIKYIWELCSFQGLSTCLSFPLSVDSLYKWIFSVCGRYWHEISRMVLCCSQLVIFVWCCSIPLLFFHELMEAADDNLNGNSTYHTNMVSTVWVSVMSVCGSDMLHRVGICCAKSVVCFQTVRDLS